MNRLVRFVHLIRLVGAVLIAAALIALVVCDLTVSGFGTWWDRHSVTTSVVSDLLVVGVTALIFNEVVAYRQLKERSLSVGAQAMIVYGQARSAYQAVMARTGNEASPAGAPDELRTLASNLLVASPNLFDDPPARAFLYQVDRLMGTLFAVSGGPAGRLDDQGTRDRLSNEMSQLQAAFEPLLARFPPDFQSLARGAS